MKESLFKIARILILTAALGQLALSQVHIEVITKVFFPTVGIVLFLFITFGVVVAFNSASLSKKTQILAPVGACILAVFFGLFYLSILLKDIHSETLLTYKDAMSSIVYSGIAIFVYIASTLTMIFTRNFDD